MSSKKKIAFTRIWNWHPTDIHLPEVLQKAFPEYEVEVESVAGWLRQPGRMGRNMLAMLSEYGGEILGGRKSWKDCFWRTRYAFQIAQQAALQRVQGRLEEYAFSFQWQSIFDTSVPGLPHFVYTDRSHLDNLNNPFFKRSQLFERYLPLEQQVYDRAAKVFTFSQRVVQTLHQEYHLPQDRAVCVYAGSHACQEDFEPGLERYRAGKILFVGTNWEGKGGPVLLRAFQRAAQRFPHASLVIAGCAPPIDLPNCRILGAVPVEEVHALYREASIFCLPTRSDAFGIAFIEAMHAALPVVATRIDVVPEIVSEGEGGLLVPPDGEDALAAALERLLADPQECLRMGLAGRRLARERYDWEQVGLRMRGHILPLTGG